MLSPAQLEAFERDGAVLVQLPLSASQLDQYERLWERGPAPFGYGGTTGVVCDPPYCGAEYQACPSDHEIDHDYIAFLAEPCFENIATQVLRATAKGVFLLQTSRMNRPPDHGRDPPEFDHRPGRSGQPVGEKTVMLLTVP